MTNFRKYILLILLFVRLLSFGQSACHLRGDTSKFLSKQGIDSLIISIEKQGFKTFNDKQRISPTIKGQLNSLTNDSFSIANPKDQYRCCCTSPKELPSRKLLFFSESKDYFIIAYLTGGMGVSTTVLIFKLQNDKLIDLWTVFGYSDFKNPNEVLNFMKTTNRLDLLHGIRNL